MGIIKTESVKEFVENRYDIDLCLQSRKGFLPTYKKFYFLLCKKYCVGIIYADMARTINLDHSTAVYGVHKLSDLLDVDDEIFQMWESCRVAFCEKFKVAEKAEIRYNNLKNHSKEHLAIQVDKLNKKARNYNQIKWNLTHENERLREKIDRLELEAKKTKKQIQNYRYRLHKIKGIEVDLKAV